MENLAVINKHNMEERFGLHSYKLAMYEFGDLVSDDTFSRDGLYQCIVYTSTIGHCVRAHAYVCVRMYPTACANVCGVHACVRTHAYVRAAYACVRNNSGSSDLHRRTRSLPKHTWARIHHVALIQH